MKNNIYDERVYLKNDEEALRAFEEKKIKTANKFNEEFVLYKEVYDEYKKFIEQVIKLLKGLNLSSSIEYSIALRYLIEKGFLSNNLKFEFTTSENEIESNYGITIITGKGVCRNLSDFHRDIMVALNEYVKRFFCTDSLFKSKAKSMKANHVLNLIKYEDTLYGIDLMNATKLFRFSDEFTLKEISFNSNARFLYKPYYELIVEFKTLEDIRKNMELFKLESKKKHISAFEYYDNIMANILQYLFRENDLFMDFHNDTKDIKDDICRRISK